MSDMAYRIQIVVLETDGSKAEVKLAQTSEEFADRQKAMDCFSDLTSDLESMRRELT